MKVYENYNSTHNFIMISISVKSLKPPLNCTTITTDHPLDTEQSFYYIHVYKADSARLNYRLKIKGYNNLVFINFSHLCTWWCETWTHYISTAENKSYGSSVNLHVWQYKRNWNKTLHFKHNKWNFFFVTDIPKKQIIKRHVQTVCKTSFYQVHAVSLFSLMLIA